MAELKKLTLRLNQNLYDWYKKESENMGVPMHSLMVMALMQYQRTEDLLPNLPNMIKAMVDFTLISEANPEVKRID